MTRRRLLALAFFSAPVVLVGVACSFPDVSYAPTATPGAETGPGNEAGSFPDGDTFREASIVVPGDEVVDLKKCTSCDCDNDHYWRDSGCDPDATDAAGRLGWGDCDDGRDSYHPNQGNMYYARYPDGAEFKFDFDCNGKPEALYPSPLTCASDLSSLFACTPRNLTADHPQAMTTPTECGLEGDIATCVSGPPCGQGASGTKATQACH